MRPPIYIDYNGDLNTFSTLEKAEEYLEPEDMESSHTRIYDSEGRLLRAHLESSITGVMGPFGLPGRQVRISSADQAPQHADELRAALIHYLKYVKVDEQELCQATLSELVALSAPYAS